MAQRHFTTADVLTPVFQTRIASHKAAASVAHNVFSSITCISDKNGARQKKIVYIIIDTQNSFEYSKLPPAQYQNHDLQCLCLHYFYTHPTPPQQTCSFSLQVAAAEATKVS